MYFKFTFLFTTFLYYVAICEETWSTKPPGGSIFMLLGGKPRMGISKHFVELKTTPPKRGRNMFTSEKLQTEFKHDDVKV